MLENRPGKHLRQLGLPATTSRPSPLEQRCCRYVVQYARRAEDHLPAGHLEHACRLTNGWYVPSGHVAHSGVLPLTLRTYLPATQCTEVFVACTAASACCVASRPSSATRHSCARRLIVGR